MTTYREMFEAELDAHGITWCRGTDMRSPGESVSGGEWSTGSCDSRRGRGGKHGTGSAWATEVPHGPTIHFGGEVATRHTMQIALHEVAHIVLGHTARTDGGYRKGPRLRAYEREDAAERWSFQRMQELGVPVPKRSRERAARYVAHKKRGGDRVIERRKGGR
jgi:hypothetical protein